MTQEVPFEVGRSYFFRTVTYFSTGKVKRIVGKFIELEDGAWVADTGRFAQALESGQFSEVEPVKVLMGINIDSIVDYFEWEHPLPRVQI